MVVRIAFFKDGRDATSGGGGGEVFKIEKKGYLFLSKNARILSFYGLNLSFEIQF